VQDRSCMHLIHGHTHQPARHLLDEHHTRLVLSDWDVNGPNPRAEVLRLRWDSTGVQAERLSPRAITNSRV
jgi:UDP-2,3-diacylglucosamine hydrolase